MFLPSLPREVHTPPYWIQNVTGHFLLPGRVDIPFTYKVRRIRDGGAYCLRGVDVYQKQPDRISRHKQSAPSDTPCFVATVSFKRQETNPHYVQYSHQQIPRMHLHQTYSSVLNGFDPTSHPLSPAGDDVPWDELDRKNVDRERLSELFPGVEIRKVRMAAYHREKGCLDGNNAGEWRQLCFYRLILEEEDGLFGGGEGDETPNAEISDQDLNLHLAAHLYASDRNSLFLIQWAHNLQSHRTQLASLAHTVIFHGPPQDSRMTDNQGQRKWFVQESWTGYGGSNRGCHESRLWTWDTGKVLGSTVQDGMVRVLKKAGTGNYEASAPESSKNSRL